MKFIKRILGIFFEARERGPELKAQLKWMVHSWVKPADSESHWEQ